MAKKESNLKTLKDVIFVYTSTNKPMKQLNKDNKPALSDHPLEFHAWEIKTLVTESVFKQMKKAFKGAKNFPNAKEYEAHEVAEKFGIEEPDEDMVLIKFSQGCLFGKKGARKESRPVGQIGCKRMGKAPNVKFFDQNDVEITAETIVGNGTKGHLQFNPVENDFGLYLYPTAICITELVEYQAAGGVSADYDAFGVEEVEGEVAEFEEPEAEEEEDQFSDPNF